MATPPSSLPEDAQASGPPEALADLAGAPVILVIAPDDLLWQAARKTWSLQFGEMLRHEPAVRLGQDSEALHDMRVATRRLRASFGVFESAFPARATRPHLKRLRAAGRALGPARDLDVLLEKAQAYQRSLAGGKGELLQPLLELWQTERGAARAAMLAYLDSAQYQKFVQAFQGWLPNPPPAKAGLSPVRNVLPGLIQARLQAVYAYERLIPRASLAELHALRIEFKKLRYLIEFFRQVLGLPAEEMIVTLKIMQDHLGELHDADVACGLLRQAIAAWDERQAERPLRERQSPQGLVAYLGVQYAERQRLMLSAPDRWDRFKQPAFQNNLAQALGLL